MMKVVSVALVLALPSTALAQSIDFWSIGVSADGSNLIAYYTTDAVGCLDLTLSTVDAPLQLTGAFCNGPGTWQVVEPMTDFLAVPGDDVQLCTPDYLFCSASIQPVVSIALDAVAIRGPDVLVTYSKTSEFTSQYGNLSTMCAHVVDGANPWAYGALHHVNWFCDDGDGITVRADLADFTPPFAEGMLVNLCHGNNYNICGFPTTVVRLPGLESRGSCPGTIDLKLSGFPAGDPYTLLIGSAAGTDPVTAGACAGTPTGLSAPSAKSTGFIGPNGGKNLSFTPPACGASLQVLDGSTCALTNVVAF